MPIVKKLLIFLLLLLIPSMADAALPNYCRRFQLPGWWGSAEYLLIWRKERFYPPLATTSPLGTSILDAGVLGLPTTMILFGDEHVGDSPESGGYFDAGFWLTPCLGFGASWTVFGKEHVNFSASGNAEGIPIIAVPFFDVDAGVQEADLLSYPGEIGFGELDIHTTNNMWAADVYARWRCCDWNCWHVDVLGGFRYTRITDNLDLTTSSVNINPDPVDPLSADTFDHFDAENDFYSGLVGFIGEYRSGRFAVQVNGRFGIGNMVKKVHISGQSIVVFPLVGEIIFPEGIFTSPSNIGTHSENSFEVVTEINAHVGVYVWRNLMVTTGYKFVYWPKIFLAGEQVDTNISVDNLTPNPSFPGRDSNFWAQALTVGIYFLY